MADKRSVNFELAANPAALKAALEESRKQFLTTFGESKAAVDKANAALEAAQAKAQSMGKALGEAGPPTRRMVEDFNAVRAAVNAAQAAVEKKTAALQRARQVTKENAEAIAAAARAERDAALQAQQLALQTAVAAKNSTIANSLSKIGARSGADILQEIAEANRAVQSLRAAGATANEMARASAAAKARVAELAAELRGTASASAAADNSLATGAHRMAAIAAAALAAKQALDLLKSSVDVGVKFDSLKTQFAFANGGDIRKAAEEMGFAAQLSNRLGLELVGTTKDFGKLQAAARGTALEGKAARDIFEAVASAGAVMGLSADEQSGVLLALSQMMSKGTVQAEELKGQLGERLPGAFQIAAKAMNVTTEELSKMLEAGQITAEQFLPRFAAALQASVKGALPAAEVSARAQLQRLENAFTEFKLRIAQSGLLDKMAAQIERVMTRIGEMADSGELQRLATQFADAFGKGIEFLANAALFAEKFAGALIPLAGGLAAVMVGGRLLALAAPATASGIAATGAAAGVAAGGFGVLGAALRLVAGGVVGFIAISLAGKLIEWGAKAGEARSKASALEGEIQNLIHSNSEHASAAMRDADAIKEFGDDAFDAYQKAIKGAQIYAAAKVVDLTMRNKDGQFDSEIAFYRDQSAAYNEYIDTVVAGEKLRREHAQLTGKLLKLDAEREKLMNGEVAKSKKEMLDGEIKGYEKLVDAIKKAREESQKEAEDAKKKAAEHKEKGNDIQQSAADKAQDIREKGLAPEEKLAADRQRANDAQSEGNYFAAAAAAAQLDGRGKAFEDYAKQAEKFLDRAMNFAEKTENADQIEDIGKQQARMEILKAKAEEKKAAEAEDRAGGLMEQLNQAEAKLKELKGQEASLKVDADITAAISKLAEVEAKMDALDGKQSTMTVNMVTVGNTPSGTAVAPADAPARAYGGPLPGTAPHDRADNMLYWGTPGEWVIQKPAVRHYGSDFISALNNMRLPKYANGGMISRLSIPSLSSARPSESRQTHRGVFDFGSLGRHTMSAAPDVFDQLSSALSREALRKGGRR